MNAMEPQIEFGTWYKVETNQGTEYLPADLVSVNAQDLEECRTLLCDYVEGSQIESVEAVEGWGYRLSMPGCLDCTSWTVFDNESEAVEYALDELYPESSYDELESMAGQLTIPDDILRRELGLIRDEAACRADCKRAALMLALDELDAWPRAGQDTTYYVGKREYLILDEEEADDATKERVEDSLWAFNSEFLAGCTDIDAEVFRVLSEKYESGNDAIRKLVDKTCGIDYVVEQAILADGRGHFLADYDGDELESGEFFVYRTN